VCPSALSVPLQLGGCRYSYASCFFTNCSCHVVLHPSGQQSAPPGVQAEALHSRVYGVIEEPHSASNDRSRLPSCNLLGSAALQFSSHVSNTKLAKYWGPFRIRACLCGPCIDSISAIYFRSVFQGALRHMNYLSVSVEAVSSFNTKRNAQASSNALKFHAAAGGIKFLICTSGLVNHL
jgi:hypothetical protein